MSILSGLKHLNNVTVEDVERLYKEHEKQLHEKIDATRDAYLGFIFPINRSDLSAVSEALELSPPVTLLIYKKTKYFSTFRSPGKKFGLRTNHIYGASTLALRGRSLDTGLNAVTNDNVRNVSSSKQGCHA